jgi:mono/diheme cytochrome c family protein
MAATDQVYRNQKTLNIVFAVSCVLMLLSTLWMLVDDYNREFKGVQRQFRDVEAQLSTLLMLDHLPNESTVTAVTERVKNAREALAAKRKELDSEQRGLLARRDKAEAEFQKWKADYDSVMSYRNIAAEHIGEAKDETERQAAVNERTLLEQRLQTIEQRLGDAKVELDAARLDIDEKINKPLDPLQKELSRAEDQMKQVSGTFDRFARLAAEKSWKAGDTFRNLPIIDAFAAPTRINQIVLEDLPIDYGGFKYVTRYDRCATCHMGIERASYERNALARLDKLQKPETEEQQKILDDLNEKLKTAREMLRERAKNGERLGFDPGDLPTDLRGVSLTSGQITQFAAHPRLELFVDGNSPHPMQKVGCTICHGGQGSSTSFTLASHTPNNTEQKAEWKKSHDWYAIHFWDFPMSPKRFTESGCLKCHHEPTSLVRYGSREEAPKLLEGYKLIRENGCFGCHEIAGNKRGRPVGPDLRLEPTPPLDWLPPEEQKIARANKLNPPGTMRKVGPSLRRLDDKVTQEWLLSWIRNPRGYRPSTKMPHFYGLSTNIEKELPDEEKGFPNAEIRSIAHYLRTESARYLDREKPGDSTFVIVRDHLKKVQGQLAKGKLFDEREGLERPWADRDLRDLTAQTVRFRDLCLMSNPAHIREINELAANLRDLYDPIHALVTAGKPADNLVKQMEQMTGALAQAAIPVPSLATLDYLIDSEGHTFPVKDIPKPEDTNEKTGRYLFMERGCVGCHSHDKIEVKLNDARGNLQTYHTEANFGPDLSRVANKLPAGDKGRRWLIQWVLNPNLHHPRTRMPITHLTVDQAANIADWLLSTKDPNWTPQVVPAPTPATLKSLARKSLRKAPGIPASEIDKILDKGLTQRYRGLAHDADELLLEGSTPIEDRLQRYIGKKAIGRMGCFGCHDIPGFENMKPIGTPLNDWGKKDPERMAFEDAVAYVKDNYQRVDSRDAVVDPTKPSQEWLEAEKTPYEEFFYEALEHHQREGFLHLKLLAPRSYDFNRIREWDDRLRMPQFRFARAKEEPGAEGSKKFNEQVRTEARAREAVMTFVLGLIAEPIPFKHLYTPKADKAAEVKGLQVLEKYNCAGCHQIRPGIYEFKIPEDQEKKQDFFLAVDHIAMEKEDHVFPDSNAWRGRPSPVSGQLMVHGVDPDTTDANIELTLTEALHYENAAGVVRDVPAGARVSFPRDTLVRTTAQSNPFGGDILPLLGAHLMRNKADEGFKTITDARAASPPPLLREGERVRPEWLYKFLLDPFKVRPLTVLRMPRFNMSGDEARALANYFASVDRLDNPGIGLTEPFLTAPQTKPYFWVRKNREYVKGMSKEQLEQRRQNLAGVWERYLEDRIIRLERDLAGAEFLAQQAAKDLEKAKDPAEKTKAMAAKMTADANRDQAKVDLATAKDLKKKAKGSDEYKEFASKWEKEQVYAGDAYRLVTDATSVCITCHSVGDRHIQGEKGPNLMLAHERLRPEWTVQWIANPKRMTTYIPTMPQNFPRGQAVNPHFLEFKGPNEAREYAFAARNALMALPWLADLPVNRYRLAPKGGK